MFRAYIKEFFKKVKENLYSQHALEPFKMGFPDPNNKEEVFRWMWYQKMIADITQPKFDI